MKMQFAFLNRQTKQFVRLLMIYLYMLSESRIIALGNNLTKTIVLQTETFRLHTDLYIFDTVINLTLLYSYLWIMFSRFVRLPKNVSFE